jgi:hypothetical protein
VGLSDTPGERITVLQERPFGRRFGFPGEHLTVAPEIAEAAIVAGHAAAGWIGDGKRTVRVIEMTPRLKAATAAGREQVQG